MAWNSSVPLNRMAAARIDRGWTQEDLAERVGAGRSQLAMWECGRSHPGLARALRHARLLGGRIEDFWDEDGRPR